MLVRIRLRHGPRVKKTRRKNQHVALALATLINPVKVAACALGVWRLAADLGMAGRFAISNGVFSHWQSWICAAAGLQCLSVLLNRYGDSDVAPLNREQKSGETILDSGF